MRVGGEYGMGVDVYEEAARMMKATDPQMWGDLTGRDLQAMGWLDTQNLWKNKGWGAPKEDANLISMLEGAEMPHTMSTGISGARDRFDPQGKKINELYQDMYNPDPRNTHNRMIDEFKSGRTGANAQHTEGVFVETGSDGVLGVYPENAIDYTDLSYGDPTDMKNTVLERIMKATADANQSAGFASHSVPAGTKDSLAGIEVFSKYNNSEALDGVLGILEKYDVKGSTFMTNSKGEKIGLRSQFSPSFENPKKIRKWMEDPAAYKEERKRQLDNYKKAAEEIRQLEGINSAMPTFHDTRAVNSIDDLSGSWWSGGERRMRWETSQQMWDETPHEGLERMYKERTGRPVRFPWENASKAKFQPKYNLFGVR